MSKLFKLKQWLTLEDAAKHLSIALGETVREQDVLRLALDGHLRLSIHLVNGAYARPCIPISLDEVEWDEVASLDGQRAISIPKGGRIWSDAHGTFQVLKAITELEDAIWDLPLKWTERYDIEQRYQSLAGGPELTTVVVEGVTVAGESGRLFELQSHIGENRYADAKTLKKPYAHFENFHPAGSLPDDSVLVVRTSAIREFERSLEDPVSVEDKPVATRERNNLLAIIAVCCKHAGIDHLKPAKAATVLSGLAAEQGISLPESTIEQHLKRVPDALRSRST